MDVLRLPDVHVNIVSEMSERSLITIKQEEENMKKLLSLVLILLLAIPAFAMADTFEAASAGFGGEVKVTLTVENGADVIILEDIEDFLLLNYSKAGRTTLQLEAVSLEELHVPEHRSVMVKDTVASLRLDNVIASAFSLSRAKAAEAIRSGIVFVNSIQSEKPDMQVDEGAKLVLRGKGKAYLREVGGRTRKDRIFIAIERFV